jgi:biopolymer transport protein ExbD
MSSFGRLDVIVLALMLAYFFAIVIHVCFRYYLVRRTRGIDSAEVRTLVARLNIEVVNLKSIVTTAPYLGLAGTCEGILSAFGGAAMQKDALTAMTATRLALALIPTAVGMLVAVLATCSYNSLQTRIDLFDCEVFDDRQLRGRHFRGAHRFPPTKRFSELPAFGLLAAPSLAIAITGLMTFGSFHKPTGFYVELPAPISRPDCGDFDVTTLEVSKKNVLTIDSKPVSRETVAARLTDIYRLQTKHILLVKADPNLTFQEVASTIDVANGSVKNPYVTLVTPGAEKEPCPAIFRARKPRAGP